MKRDREVVNCTRSRVKNNSRLINLVKISRIEAYNGKYGQIHRELGKFFMISLNLIKSNDELIVEIGENVRL